MISALLVDDEQKNRDSLQKLLAASCPSVRVIGQASCVADALTALKSLRPELVFLDVEMPNGSGFDLLRQLNRVDFKVIFVTAHAHYAIKAIKFSAVDYLLKPVDGDDLIAAVARAEGEPDRNHHDHYKGLLDNIDHYNSQKLAIPVKDGLAFLAPDEIIRLEADGTYTHFFINGQKLTASKNIKEYEGLLMDCSFFRSHNSHLINLRHVKKFSRIDGYFVEMSDGSMAELSRRKKDEFMELMGKNK